VGGALSPGKKRPERNPEKSSPSSAVVKNAWSFTVFPIRFHGEVLNEEWGQTRRNNNMTFLLSHYSLCLFEASDFSFLIMDPSDIW
jgi:hypothetical protein